MVGLLYALLCTVLLPFVSCENLLGFVWGDTDHLKSENESHFISDLNHISVELLSLWLFCIITTIWTIIWLIHHTTSVPHYKFEFYWLSKLSIRTHILSGSIEFILMYIAYFYPNTDTFFYIIIYFIVFFDILHDITGYYQTPNVYGQKYFTIPGYIWCITFKLLLSIYLALKPLSNPRLMILYVTHSQFTWLRLLYYIFMKLKIFQDHLYSISAFIAIIFCQSYISGPNGCLLFLIYAICSVGLFRLIKPKFALGGYLERGRNAAFFITDDKLDYLIRAFSQSNTLKDKSGVLFEYIDKNDNASLTLNELL